MATRNDDEYEDDLADPEFTPLYGGPPSDIQIPVAETLLQLSGVITQLGVQLSEADDQEFKAIRPRLEFVKRLVADLPAEPQTRRNRIGFKVRLKRNKRSGQRPK